MKVLLVNKFYYQRGGAETYILEIEKKLRAEGHEVAIFSMHHPKNLESIWSKYFVSRVSFNEGNIFQRLKGAIRIFYSLEAKRKFTSLLNDFKPDIIHIHNIYHQISPSILPVAKRFGVPVIMHLHDYKLICPNYQLFDGKRICYDCLAPNYWQCFLKKCFGNSYLKSFLVSAETFFHHKILNIYQRNINLYIAPSKFMKDISVRSGIPKGKIIVLYNFIFSKPVTEIISKNYILYVGRLSSEKGVMVLIEAIKKLPQTFLKIVGAGPQQLFLQKKVIEYGLSEQIEFMGHKNKEDVEQFMKEAKAVVIPSVWLENMPFTLLEAMSLGRVVIASKIGGLTELINNRENGLIFEANDSEGLKDKINILEKVDCQKIGLAAKQTVLKLNLEAHFKALLELYLSVK